MKCIKLINQAYHEIFESDERTLLIGEDILDPYGGAFKVSKGLSDKYPDRVYTTPISEAGIVGIANGMALKGLYPIVEIMFGDFITLTFDQIVNYLTKFKGMYDDQVDPHVVIRTPMGGYRGYGPTHSQSLEKHFLGVPNLSIFALSHLGPIDELLKNAVLKQRGPVLLIENKMLYGYDNNEIEDNRIKDFSADLFWNDEVSYTLTLKIDSSAKADYTVVTYGGTTPFVMDAVREVFLEEELNGEILVLSSLNQIDLTSIEKSLKDSGKIVVVEEGMEGSTFGDYLISSLMSNTSLLLKEKPLMISAKSGIIPSNKEDEIQFLPNAEDIQNKIISYLV